MGIFIEMPITKIIRREDDDRLIFNDMDTSPEGDFGDGAPIDSCSVDVLVRSESQIGYTIGKFWHPDEFDDRNGWYFSDEEWILDSLDHDKEASSSDLKGLQWAYFEHLEFTDKMILHTKITTETICKNGSEKYGAKARCEYSTNGKMFIEVSMHGDSKSHARKKLKDFLSSNGNDKTKLIKR